MLSTTTLLSIINSDTIIGAVVTAIAGFILFVLKWIRFKPSDAAINNKTDAETEKVRAEAQAIKVKSDVTIADTALKLAQTLQLDADKAKQQLEKAQDELDKAADLCKVCTEQLAVLKAELKAEQDKNTILSLRIQELMSELDKIKNSKNE